MYNLLSGISTLLVFLFLTCGYFFRNAILKWVQERIEHNFNEKLETLKSDLKKNEDTIKYIRDSTIFGSSLHRKIIIRKKIEAVEKIWETIVKIKHSITNSASIIGTISIEEALKLKNEQNVSQFIDIMVGFCESQSPVNSNEYGEELKIYLPPLLVSLYETYLTLYYYTRARVLLLKSKDEKSIPFVSDKKLISLLMLVFPGLEIEKIHDRDLVFLLEEVEKLVYVEIVNFQKGQQITEEDINRSAAIDKAAKSISLGVEAKKIDVPESIKLS